MAGTPTLAGFQSFITNIMGIPSLALPSTSPVIAWVFDYALATVNPLLGLITAPAGSSPPVSYYVMAVYNLAGDQLVNLAPDQPGRTYFADMRNSYELNAFVPGVVSSTGDEGTNTSIAVSEALNRLTLSDLQNLKTPWGRQYLMLAQKMGSNWGLT